MNPIYLDYNATTPIPREVAEAMEPYLYEQFGNPSSSHPYGVVAKRAVESARARVAALLGCQAAEVIFTSGGTESNNYAIKGAAFARREHGNHVITSAVEHPAVMEVCRWLEPQGFRVTVLHVDEHGLVDPADLERIITPDTTLVTVMHANNEVGTIEPISELAEIAHRFGALMHSSVRCTSVAVPSLPSSCTARIMRAIVGPAPKTCSRSSVWAKPASWRTAAWRRLGRTSGQCGIGFTTPCCESWVKTRSS
jgi:cysteine sulfinate desulfinase/cysteine desulfurase-like protein